MRIGRVLGKSMEVKRLISRIFISDNVIGCESSSAFIQLSFYSAQLLFSYQNTCLLARLLVRLLT